MTLFYIDTTSSYLYTAIVRDNSLLIERKKDLGKSLSVETTNIVSEMFNEVNLKPSDINKIIVVNGPGSFTGERIAVTIGKTIAFLLRIPIRVIDSLTILALNVEDDNKNVAITDRNGAFVGAFDGNNQQIGDYSYLNKSNYQQYCENNKVYTDLEIDYEKVYDFVMKTKELNPHEVKPLYVKGISALNDK